MRNLFYTVEKETQTYSEEETCTGWKAIQVYEIVNDTPKLWFELDSMNERSSEEDIQFWLDNNGFEDREYELIRL